MIVTSIWGLPLRNIESVSCYRLSEAPSRGDRMRIGASCPFVRLIPGAGDHLTGARPCPDPVWETASVPVAPALTAAIALPGRSGGESTRNPSILKPITGFKSHSSEHVAMQDRPPIFVPSLCTDG
jgi:hypothetical protein